MSYRIGQGYDAHRFGPGDGIVIGGERLPFDRGVVAHSDGDVLLHAVCDALLAATRSRTSRRITRLDMEA